MIIKDSFVFRVCGALVLSVASSDLSTFIWEVELIRFVLILNAVYLLFYESKKKVL